MGWKEACSEWVSFRCEAVCGEGFGTSCIDSKIFALLQKMTWLDTVHAKAVCFHRTDFLIMRQKLKALTGVQWMFFFLAGITIGRWIRSACRKRCNGPM